VVRSRPRFTSPPWSPTGPGTGRATPNPETLNPDKVIGLPRPPASRSPGALRRRQHLPIATIDGSIRVVYCLAVRNTDLTEALETLGALLDERGLTFDVVVVGGGALLLQGLVRRPTKDLDVVALVEGEAWVSATPLPDELTRAAREVAGALDLGDDWLNAGPTSLLDLGLPPGCETRAVVKTYGGLTLRVAAREDQVAFKLYAAADHWPDLGKHLQDLRELRPTPEELRRAAAWCRTHDPSQGFRDVLLVPVLATFGVEAGDAG
jgi:hypothetical protein